MLLDRLLDLLEQKKRIMPEDRAYTQNLLLDALAQPEPPAGELTGADIAGCLAELSEWAAQQGVIPDTGDEKDRFSARLAGAFTPHPAQVRAEFYRLLSQQGPEAATHWFYSLCRDVDYIRVSRIAQNIRFLAQEPCGELESPSIFPSLKRIPGILRRPRAHPRRAIPSACCAVKTGLCRAGGLSCPAEPPHRVPEPGGGGMVPPIFALSVL